MNAYISTAMTEVGAMCEERRAEIIRIGESHIVDKIVVKQNDEPKRKLRTDRKQGDAYRTYKAFRKDFKTAPSKGYSAVNKGWFIGYKLHVVIYDNGVVQQTIAIYHPIFGQNVRFQTKNYP